MQFKGLFMSAVLLISFVTFSLVSFSNISFAAITSKIEPLLTNYAALMEKGLISSGFVRVIVERASGQIDAKQVKVGDISSFENDPTVVKVYADRKVAAQLNDSVPLIKNPAEWKQIEENYGSNINGTGEKIAILDTGIDKTHPDLDDLDDDPSTNDPKVILEKDFTGSGHVYDDNGHGTHVASIAAGTGEASNYTYVGVAPGSWLLNGKVLDQSGNGWESWVIAGVQWAVNNGANVISLSLGEPYNNDGTDPLSQTVDWAVGQGVVCVVAAGNNGNTYYSVGNPACAKEAITVGATDKTDKIAWFSSFGPTSDFRVKPEILAPGVNIVAARANGTSRGTVINQYYTMRSGTSMAAPHVAGAVALLLQAHPDWTPETVKAALIETAKQVYPDVLAEGGGRIQIAKAVNLTSFVYPSTLSFGKIKESTSLNLTVSTAAFNTSVIDYFTTGITVSAAKTENIVRVSVGGDLTEGYYSGAIVVSGEDSLQVPFFVAVYKSYPSGNWHVVNEETVPSNIPHRFVIDGNYIYVGCFDVPGAVYKYSLPDLSLLAAITLPQDKVNSMALLGDYLYVGTATVPAHLFKLNATDLSIVADVALSGTNALELTTWGGYLFVSYSMSPGVVEKVDPASLQVIKTLHLSSNADSIQKLVPVGNYLYGGVYDYAGSTGHYSQICKIDPVSLTVLKTLNFDVGTTNLRDMVEVNGSLYACTLGNAVPAKIIKVDLVTFQIVDTLSLGLFDSYIYHMNYANGHLYLASAEYHGTRVSLSTFEKDLELPLSDQAVEVACWQDYVFFGGFQHRKIITTRDAEANFYLTILPAVGGDTNPPPGTYEYPEGTVVQITPLPDALYVFSYWIVDGSQVSDNPLLVTMNANHTVQPVFTKVQTYFLEMKSTVGGSVDPSVGIHEYKAGTVVTIKATADLNYKFKWWIIDGVCYITNPNWITMAYNRTVEAVFEEVPTYWNLTILNSEGGTTNGTSGSYLAGTNITITAFPSEGYLFDYWIVNGEERTENPLTITMGNDYVIQPIFSHISVTLTVDSSEGGSTKPEAGTYTYYYGSKVVLEATANEGYLFSHWIINGEVVTDNPASLTLVADTLVQPVFAKASYFLTISATAGGTTAPEVGTHEYTAGTVVTITATPNAGYTFKYWQIDGVNYVTNPNTITMSQNRTVCAVFEQINYYLTITATAGGTTNPAGSLLCHYGDQISITAVPNTGYFFSGWLLDGSPAGSANPYVIVIDGSHSLQAVFQIMQYQLTIVPVEGGSTVPPAGSYTRNYGTTIIVTAAPNNNYLFDHWLLDGERCNNATITVIFNANHTLQPVFTLIQYQLTIQSAEGGSTAPPAGTYLYTIGTKVTVTATPNSGYKFDHWTLDGSNAGSTSAIILLMNCNHTLQPVFRPAILYELAILPSTNGKTSPPPGKYLYPEGALVQVVATASPDFQFSYWILDGKIVGKWPNFIQVKGSNTIQVMMYRNHTLQAVFSRVSYTLIISVTGEGTTNPAPGTYHIKVGTWQTIKSIPSPTGIFVGWYLDGSYAGNSKSITVKMSTDHKVEARFVNKYVINLTVYDATGSPISGVIVKLDGITVGRTDNYGRISVEATAGVHLLSLSKPLYYNYICIVSVDSEVSLNVTLTHKNQFNHSDLKFWAYDFYHE
jgi:protein involved in ribonucleotide reduction